MSEQPNQAASFPGIDAADNMAEQIFPPEQTPMDDAISRPQVTGSGGPLEGTATNGTPTDDLFVQGGE